MTSSAVTVAVRCRPFSQKEIAEGSTTIISMGDNSTTIIDPTGKIKPLTFAYDFSIWSGDADNEAGTQEAVYKNIGATLLDNAFNGFNGCLFAYGQTGSGKTYSMLGYGGEKGVIPRLCSDLFARASTRRDASDGSWEFHVEVSYLEIYNEKCRCLLSPNGGKNQEYRVREHPVTGPYVENLTKIIVHTFEEIEQLMEEGNKTRTVASTNMNATSSRSHAIFTIVINQTTTHKELNGSKSEMTARLNLVDLAGSERADRTGATGKTLKEGSNINQSLTSLGKVINALAEGAGTASSKKHIPFRDSALTWILKDNLCGNSKTTMLAALSPAASNYDETVSTLRYADRAKNLRTVVQVNEDPSSKKIRELMAEIDRLRGLLQDQQQSPRNAPSTKDHNDAASPTGGVEYESLSTKEKLELAQKLMREESLTWEEREHATEITQAMRAKVLENLPGLRTSAALLQRERPSLVNLNEDPSMNECLVYILEDGNTEIGRVVPDPSKDIQLEGEGILEHHATLHVQGIDDGSGLVQTLLRPCGKESECFVNVHVFMAKFLCTRMTVSSSETIISKDIQLEGEGILEHHATLHVQGIDDGTGLVQTLLRPCGKESECFVNGARVHGEIPLHPNDRVIFGKHHIFRFCDPKASRHIQQNQQVLQSSGADSLATSAASQHGSPNRPIDFNRAMEERFQAERQEFQRQQEALQREVDEQKRLREEQEAKLLEQQVLQQEQQHQLEQQQQKQLLHALQPVTEEQEAKLLEQQVLQQEQQHQLEQQQQQQLLHALQPVTLNNSFVSSINDDANRTIREQSQRLKDMEDKLRNLEDQQKQNLSLRYLSQTSVKSAIVSEGGARSDGESVSSAATAAARHQDPSSPTLSSSSPGGSGANKLRSSLIHAAHIAGARSVRLPNQQIFRQKLVLLGHQEVGKTSLRKCFESDPLFFMKKLPDVRSTTGIETLAKSIKVESETVELTVADFAGQEAYHSHTLFLTNRSVFALIWKISAVEQDFQSSGISEHEEKRLHRWISEVYSKFPKAKICVIATHLDELRDQSQKGVEMILAKVERLLTRFMESIARIDPATKKPIVNPIMGSFAVSCKQRIFIGAGRHRALSGGKLSSLLQLIATSAYESCMEDEVFRCGAIPGRHIRLTQEIQDMKAQHPQKLLLPLSEYVHMAVRCGVESDEELLQISTLLHSWNHVFLFNQHRLNDNLFIFLHPAWLCRLAGVLFSYAHVLQTPSHLRSIIGGLEFSVTQAEQADMHMVKKGFLRLPLAKVLFRKCLTDFLKRDPEDADFDMCLQLLSALGLIEAVQVPCDDVELLLDETPGTPRRGTKVIQAEQVHRYFVPSLSPFTIPAQLKSSLDIMFQRGVKVRFEFNMLPNEMWWRLQSRLQQHQQVITVRCPRAPTNEDDEEDFDDDEYRLPEADDDHNRWRDAMWLKNRSSRIMIQRDGPKILQFFSIEVASQNPPSPLKPDALEGSNGGADELLQVIEESISELLQEYRGVQRTIQVACPVPACTGWHDVNTILPELDCRCAVCRQTFPPDAAVVSGVSPLGAHQFSANAHSAACELMSFALDDRVCEHVCKYLGIHYHPPPLKKLSANDSQTMSDDEDADVSGVDILTSVDKVIRASMLKQIWQQHQK
ncbi:kinesin-like protein, putative [Bodo saltans]|uniref:Kinesin-like protein, putative n=1 Tax=Bodo saltans TaxID=75058 RepID=A0A0S4II98_BODSA|nr:kinesin-like protein, putative [Bodo saltans]|eukprot:CUE71264.1 kinesin-like protein, putative [Bodo saltans]